MRIFEDNQPVTVAGTGEWGRVTDYTVWNDAKEPTELYRVEFPDGSEQWHEYKNLRISSVLAGLNTPYFWTIGLGFLIVGLCAFGIL